jgi:hypothetical protein
MCAGRRVDQLSGDAYPAAGFAYRAFEDVTHAEFASDSFYIDRLALIGEARI